MAAAGSAAVSGAGTPVAGPAGRDLFAEGLLEFLRPAVQQLDSHVHAVRAVPNQRGPESGPRPRPLREEAAERAAASRPGQQYSAERAGTAEAAKPQRCQRNSPQEGHAGFRTLPPWLPKQVTGRKREPELPSGLPCVLRGACRPQDMEKAAPAGVGSIYILPV
ncbi:SNARE-associated protein Snapin isoform X1 [Canis lupus baileyi]|uniref:SNARE-associated protein Snapin isoform X1 n=1 Tax=Canis lupus baileyi TaxID=143281 RepID=UPI003B978044